MAACDLHKSDTCHDAVGVALHLGRFNSGGNVQNSPHKLALFSAHFILNILYLLLETILMSISVLSIF